MIVMSERKQARVDAPKILRPRARLDERINSWRAEDLSAMFELFLERKNGCRLKDHHGVMRCRVLRNK
jgi:hypothetical protein